MKIAAYLRVSTDQQANNGGGLEVQRAALGLWCEQQGHEIALWSRDEGISGSNGLESRIGLYEALRAVESGDVGGVAVYRLDRLARDLVLQETLLARIWSHDASAFSTDPTENETLQSGDNDPTRNLTRQILGAIAEYERALIVMRLRSGKLAKQVRGGYVGGKVPYGYRLEDDSLIEVTDEQEAITLMATMHADGASLRSIIADLDRRNIPPKSGKAWYPTTVRAIVSRQNRES